MPTDDLDAELAAVRETARDDPDLTLLAVTDPPATETFTLTERPLPEAVDLARDLGAAELYLFTERTGDGDLGRAGLAFFHRDHLHTVYRESTAWTAPQSLPVVHEDETTGSRDGSRSEDEAEADPDAQRKRELADELLTEYADYIDEGDEYRLRHRLEYMPLPRLLEMREQAQQRARVDPEEEERLARIVFRDGRFNRQYDPRDTQMLLDALEVDYDPETVRIEEIHRRAMSLKTVDR